MTFEVASPEFDRAHARILRGVPADVGRVVLHVLTEHGGRVTNDVDVVMKRSGRGVHRRFACPACTRCAAVLVTVGLALRCAGCSSRLTRRQAEHTGRAWRELDGELEDTIIRAARAGKLATVRRGISALRLRDESRVAALLTKVEVALAALNQVGGAPASRPQSS